MAGERNDPSATKRRIDYLAQMAIDYRGHSHLHDGTPDNPENETRGAETIVVEGGREVAALDDGRYRIAASGEILVRDER
jgi:hypothetical protein